MPPQPHTPKSLKFSEEARSLVLQGAELMKRAVGATMGPHGRCVVLDSEFSPSVTRDGVTVAKAIAVKDRFQNIGCKLVKEASVKTNELAGDGTTATVVLAEEMMRKGHKEMKAGRNAMLLRKGMLRVCDELVKSLQDGATEISSLTELESVASISASDPEIGKIVAELVYEIGENAIIHVEMGRGTGMEVERIQGVQFLQGYISNYFINDPSTRRCVLKNPLICLYDGTIRNTDEILPVLRIAAGIPMNPKSTDGMEEKRELLVICEDMVGSAWEVMGANVCVDVRLPLFKKACVVRTPDFGGRRKDFLDDISLLTGGRTMAAKAGLDLQGITKDCFGTAKEVIVNWESTTIMEGGGDKSAMDAHVAELKELQKRGFTDFEQEKLNERIARLTSGIAVIKVGGSSEVEQREKIERVQDAICASKAALEEGILPGGGVAFIRAGQRTKEQFAIDSGDEKIGIDIVFSSLSCCCRTIAENAGENGEFVVKRVEERSGPEGFNALSGKYENLYESQIFDPLKVLRCALQHAVSIAAMFLVMEAAVIEEVPTAKGEAGLRQP